MTEDAPILKARGLNKRYGRVVALDNADFDLYPNEVLGVIGDNGAGKSTLIKALCGAVIPDSGTIELDGQQVHFRSPMDARAAGIETVYQNLALSPALSIAALAGVDVLWQEFTVGLLIILAVTIDQWIRKISA